MGAGLDARADLLVLDASRDESLAHALERAILAEGVHRRLLDLDGVPVRLRDVLILGTHRPRARVN